MVISPTSGTDVITDLNPFEGDKIALAGGLTFGDLTLTNEVVPGGLGAVLTSINFNGTTLATFLSSWPLNDNLITLTQSDFILFS